MKTKFKKGDIVYWQDLQGVVIDIDDTDYPIIVQFINDYIDYFTNDGRIYLKYHGRIDLKYPPVLSHTPYTLNGFTQNSVIEKDTIVWVRNSSDEYWQQRFYSHFKDGNKYCFDRQKTSKETNGITAWNFLETENPLLKKLNP